MFQILTVCTGNIARSPLAEALLRRYLPANEFAVRSAGMLAAEGGAAPAQQRTIAAKLGLNDLERHRATKFVPGHIGRADLLLGMSRRHRKQMVQMDPTAVRKIFTLREFAHLAPHVTPDDVSALRGEYETPLKAAVEAVATMRGMVPPPELQEDLDVVDPFKRSRSVYRQSREELVPAVEITAAYLNGILKIFGDSFVDASGAVAKPTIDPHYEPDVVSQGIPQVMNGPYPSRAAVHAARGGQVG